MKKFVFLSVSTFIALLMLALVSCSDDTPNNPPDDNTVRIDSVTPDMGYVGFQIKIYGKNFGDARGNSIIKFGSTIIQEANIKTWSPTLLTITLPENLPAAKYKVTVTVDGVESNEVDFEVLEKSGTAPVITNLSKKTATTGEPIRIYGQHFGNPQTTSWVTFNGVKADSIISWTKFQLLKMVDIKAGTYMMGDDNSSELDNKPAHKVTITKDFLMSETEITQKQWMTIMDNSNPSHPPDTGATKPVQQVTFQRAAEFCNRLSEAEGYTPVYTINGDDVTWNNTNANGYRLPTEAEWEYACRAGRKEDYTNAEVLNMAWVSENAGGMSKEVGTRAANAFGLYDMLGNVAEWCWDYYDADYYQKSPENDPRGPETSDFNHRIIRGGSYVNGASVCNSSLRDSYPGTNSNYNYNLGFRVVRNK